MKRRQSWCKKKKMNIFQSKNSVKIFPILEYDGDTLERVWQSLFKVYKQTLRQMGDNDFSVEHTGVRVRQMVGTDAVAFQKAWDFLAFSDDEDNYFYLFIYFSSNYFPRKGSKIWPFGGDCFFCSRWPMQGNELRKKLKTKKRQRFRKNHRRGHRTRARARINITPQTFGTEEVYAHYYYYCIYYVPRDL